MNKRLKLFLIFIVAFALYMVGLFWLVSYEPYHDGALVVCSNGELFHPCDKETGIPDRWEHPRKYKFLAEWDAWEKNRIRAEIDREEAIREQAGWYKAD